MTEVRRTRRWRGVAALAFFGIGFGVLLKRPALLVAGTVAVGYAAMSRGAGPPAVELSIERELSATEPRPGEAVTVETTVRNEGDGALPDLRVVDGVPPGLSVVSGVPRTYTALRSGESATFSYHVEAARGEHAFRDATAFARDASGAVEVETTVPAAGPTVTCTPRIDAADAVPLRSLTSNLAGTVTSDQPGPGNEFHSVREYRSGDPLSRVDWNRFAETGELATVQYGAERMATVVLVVDVRSRAFVETGTEHPHAVEHCIDAARMLAGGLLRSGNRVGVAGLGPEVSYLGPGLGRAHRARVRDFLATELPRSPPEEKLYPRHLDELRRRLEGNLQVLWLSPLVDDYAIAVARTLVTDGHAVTVVSPDVTRTGTPGERLGRAERSLRLTRLREADVRVVDWRPDSPLETAVVAAQRGWTG